MLDTIIFKIINANDEQIKLLYNSLEKIDKSLVTSHNSINGIPDYFKGKIKSLLIVKNTGNTIKISGSLSSFYYGNNVKTLTYRDLCDALMTLSNQIGISLDEAKLIRLDISSIAETDHKPSLYYSSLIAHPYKRRHTETDGIYFNSVGEQITIYDKGKKNKIDDGKNYLRYEHALLTTKKIKSSLLIERVLDLKSEEIFNRLVQFWYDSYTSTSKVSKVYDSNNVKSVSGMKQFLYSLGIDALGGISSTIDLVNELREKGNMNGDIAYKCRNTITGMYTGPKGKVENDLIKELNQAFKSEYDRLLIP